MDRAVVGGGAEIYRLPEECVAYAISLTTPGDACSSSAVSPAFRAAADSDAVWARFLPGDHAAVLARADRPPACASKKDLFSRLCDRPVLLDGATMLWAGATERREMLHAVGEGAENCVGGRSFVLDMDTCPPRIKVFPEVAELVDVCCLEITGRLQLSLLTPGTTYAAYLVFSVADDSYGLECHIGIQPPKATLTLVSGTKQTAAPSPATTTTTVEHAVCLHHMQGEEEAAAHRRKQVYTRLRKDYGRKPTREADPDIRCPRRRADGWAEVEMGEFAVAGDEDAAAAVEVTLREAECRRWKRGLIVQGIEIRPKQTHELINP
ncbi:hypothetical protein ACP4OV_001087 [Aristida adscensionis]